MSTTERIDIVVSERGAPTVARQIAAIGDQAEKSAVQTNRLRSALLSLGAATGALQLAKLVDTYTNMQNRLKVVTTSSGQLKAVQQDLFAIANRTRSAYESTVEMFGRMSLALKDAGISTETLLKVTESLNKATIISGATSTEAKNALIQLSQGLASGTLRGDELRSVLEQLPVVADAIAAKLGVTRGALRKLAEEGKITTRTVVDAVKDAATKWDELFAKSAPTMSQALTVVKNRFMEVIGTMDEQLGASAAAANVLLFLAKNMDIVAGAAATLATALSITLVQYALNIAIGRMLDFLRVMIGGPLIAMAQAVGTLSTALLAQAVAFGNASKAGVIYLATMTATTISAVGRIVSTLALVGTAATRSVNIMMLLSFTMMRLASAGPAILALLNPFNLLSLAAGGAAAMIGGTLRLAIGGLAGALSGAVALIGTVGSLFFSLVKILALVGVGFVTLGDKTTMATNSTVTYADFAIAAWNRIKVGFGQMYDFLTALWPKIGDGAENTFGRSGNAFLRFAQSTAKGMDFLIAAFGAAYDTILSSWRSFPAALLDIVVQAVQAAYRAVVDFIYKAYDFLKNAFSKIIALDFSGVAAGGLDTQVSGAAERVSDTFNQALEKRLKDSTAFADALKQTTAEAEKVSTDRISKEKAELEALNKAREAYKLSGPDKTTPGDDSKMGRKSFADYLAELQREQQLGLATGDAYKVLNEQIQISNKLRRDLTETEKGQIETAVIANQQLERKRNLLSEITGPTQEYGLQVQALTALFNEGHITLDQFNQKFFQLRENFLNGLPEATTFADGFVIQLEKMKMATRNGFGQMGTEVGKIFGPGGTLINGIGDAVAQSIVFGKSFKEQIRQVAQSILSQLISSLVKMGLNMILNATLGQSLMAASTATGVAQGAALTAAYAPAAAMSSLATGGANAAGASTGISTIFSLLASLGGSLFGAFKEGGYTGAVGVNDVAGVVHGQEFVINAAATKRHRSMLEALNAGKDPTQAVQAMPVSQPLNVSITNEIPDAAYEVRTLSETDVEIIAKRIVRRETPEVVAQDLRNPNSRTSKGLSSNTTANRRR